MRSVMTDVDKVRLTYAELAAARRVSLNAARRMTLRHKWPKQLGNDGIARVSVPISALPRADGTGDAPGTAAADTAVDAPAAIASVVTLAEASIIAVAQATTDGVSAAMTATMRDALSDVRQILPTLQDAIAMLRVELYAERERADRAEQQV